MKRYLILIIALCICAFSVTSCNKQTANDFTQDEYSENIETIKSYFPEFYSINNVYFKSICPSGNSRVVGPSTFNIAGFICLSMDEVNIILQEYEFVKAEPEFRDGISPTITGYSDFLWYTSYEFTRYLLKGNYVGDVYIDTENCVIYVDVQTA